MAGHLFDDIDQQCLRIEFAPGGKTRRDAVNVFPFQVPGRKTRPGVAGLDQLQLQRIGCGAGIEPGGLALQWTVKARIQRFEMNRHRVGFVHYAIEDDITGLGNDGIVVVRI